MVAYIDEQYGATSRESVPRERRFPWSLRGYRRKAVDQHIAALERELDELDHELVALRAAATLREEVANEMRRICEETASILVEAHNQRDAMTHAAQEQADRLIADATAKATAITAESEAQVHELEAQREAAQLNRDRLLETALAASAALADAVHAAHQQVPPTTPVELTTLESDQYIELEATTTESAAVSAG